MSFTVYCRRCFLVIIKLSRLFCHVSRSSKDPAVQLQYAFLSMLFDPAITELIKTKCLYKMTSDSLPDVLMLFFLCSRTYVNLEKSTNMIVLPMVDLYKIYLKYNIYMMTGARNMI